MSEPKIIKIDSQILDAFSRCERLFEYSFIHNLTSIESSYSIQRGSLVHDIIMTYYVSYKESRNKQASMIKALDFGRARVSHYDSIDVVRGIEILDNVREYFNYYANERWIPIEIEKIHKKVIYQDDEIVVIYVCKIDLTCAGDDVPVLIVDHKTHDRYYPPLALENQFTGYSTVLGVNQLVVNKIGFQKSYKAEDKFRRVKLVYTEPKKEEWIHNTVRIAKDLVYCLETGTFPQRRTQCGMYGGCKFQQVCDVDPRARQEIIRFKYKQQPQWNPDEQKEVEG